MTDPVNAEDDLVERLRRVESGDDSDIGNTDAVTCWYRNPDGPEAADRIAALEAGEIERPIVAALCEALSGALKTIEGDGLTYPRKWDSALADGQALNQGTDNVG